jgi:hypothetical protein
MTLEEEHGEAVLDGFLSTTQGFDSTRRILANLVSRFEEKGLDMLMCASMGKVLHLTATGKGPVGYPPNHNEWMKALKALYSKGSVADTAQEEGEQTPRIEKNIRG